MPYVAIPSANVSEAGLITSLTGAVYSATEAVTGLTNGVAYKLFRLSSASGTFTPVAAVPAMTNILGQLDGSGAAVNAAFGSTLTAITATYRSDSEGYALGLRAAHVPTGAYVIGAEVSKTVTSGNVSIVFREMTGGTDTSYTLRYSTAFGILANVNLVAGEFGLLDMGDTYRLWIKKSGLTGANTRVMLNINNDAGTQSWRRAFLFNGTDHTLPWAAAA